MAQRAAGFYHDADPWRLAAALLLCAILYLASGAAPVPEPRRAARASEAFNHAARISFATQPGLILKMCARQSSGQNAGVTTPVTATLSVANFAEFN